jgi:hypothetical protein
MAKRIEAVSVQSGIQAYASLRAGENLGHWRRSAERVGSNPGFLQCAHLPDGVLMGFAHMRPDRIAASISALSVALNA